MAVKCGEEEPKPHHRDSRAMMRLLAVPTYDGQVVPGREYILVDDAVTSGSTLAYLRHYIEGNGGRVVGYVALAASYNRATGSSKTIGITQNTIDKLHRKYNIAELERELEDNGIAPTIGHLTNSQGRYIALFRNIESFRSGIDQAKQRINAEGVGGQDSAAKASAPPQSRLKQARFEYPDLDGGQAREGGAAYGEEADRRVHMVAAAANLFGGIQVMQWAIGVGIVAAGFMITKASEIKSRARK